VTPVSINASGGYTWNNNNITWNALSSSTYPNGYCNAYGSFISNLVANGATSSNGWTTATPSYNGTTATAGAYTGSYTTYLQNSVGTIAGEWLQIQSSVPVKMNSFYLLTNAYNSTITTTVSRLPKTFYICGSNDNSTWYPILYGNWTSLPVTTTSGALLPTNTYTIPAGTTTGGTLTGSTTTGPGTAVGLTYNTYGNGTNAYLYFRMIVTNIIANNFSVTCGDGATAYCTSVWYPTFTVAQQSGPSRSLLYMDPSNINQLDVSGSLALVNSNASTMMVSPNTTAVGYYGSYNMSSYSWINNNITWTASANNSQATTGLNGPAYSLFDNTISGTSRWISTASNTSYSTSTGIATGTAGTTTILNSVGLTTGDWCQIQASVPLIMKNFTLSSFGATSTGYSEMPGKFYICGSTDATNWYPLIYIAFSGTQVPTGSYTSPVYNILTGTTSGASISNITTNSSGTYNTYGNGGNAYTYFRLITTQQMGTLTTGGTNDGWLSFAEWNINFTPVSSTISMSLDPGIPNQLNIGGSLAVAGGVTPMYSTTPNFTPNQIGYIYYTTLTNTAVAITSNSAIMSISNVLPGVYMAYANLIYYSAATNSVLYILLTYNSFSGPYTFLTNMGTSQTNWNNLNLTPQVITVTSTTTVNVNLTIATGGATWAPTSQNFFQLVRIA